MSEPELTKAQNAAAVVRLGENLALLSGAGCGKTYVLARRFTELLLNNAGGENPLSRFAALTFTDKAAMEMSQRVRLLLSQRAAKSKGADRVKLLGWLQEVSEARISTIHSFCAALLRSHAVEAGLDPSFAVCANTLVSDVMLAEAGDEAVLAAVEAGDEAVTRLLGDLSYDRLVGVVAELVSQRTVCRAEDYADAGAILTRWDAQRLEQSRQAWQSLREDEELARRIEEVEALQCGKSDDELNAYRRDLLMQVRRLIADPTARTPRTFEALADGPGSMGRDAAWGGKGTAKIARDQMRQLLDVVNSYGLYVQSPGESDRRAADALAALMRLAGQAQRIYAAAKRAEGLLDFTDLLFHAHRLLAENGDVRRSLRRQLDQLLIDECQDTDGFQVALLSMLMSDDPQPAAGRLFVVGDAKQSIYRFRGAQVEVFKQLCETLGRGNRENLDVSFRTHEAGLEFVNHLFTPLMGADYTPIHAKRPEVPPRPSVEILLAGGTEEAPLDGAPAAAEAQAALTAQRIRQMIDGQERIVWDRPAKAWRPVRAGDIAILFSRMTNSLEFERQLARREVPYYVVGGTGFFQQQEVFDVLNVLRAVDNPFDDIALMGALRSSIFGLDDNALMQIAESMDPPYFERLAPGGAAASDAPAAQVRTQVNVSGLDEPRRRTLEFAMDLLRRLHEMKDAVGIDAIIERLLEETLYEATLLSQFQGRRMVGNVRLLIEQARAAQASAIPLADFIRQMGELVLSESKSEQSAVAGEAEDVVRLMTIHKAKGLEFPVVFVPDLNAGKRNSGGMLLNRLDWGLTLRLAPQEEAPQDGGEDEEAAQLPLSYQMAMRPEQIDRRKEEVRKFYVALTRHEDHLVLVGADWRGKEGQFLSSGSFLQQLDSVFNVAGAIDSGERDIAYGSGGKFRAALRRVVPEAPQSRRRVKPLGEQLLEQAASAENLADAIAAAPARQAALPLLGELPPEIGRVELAVTSLAEFEHCPMLYRWRELGIAPPPRYAAPAAPARAAAFIDAATAGTAFHRCMELLDFSHPQPPEALVAQAAAELEIADAPALAALTQELHAMLDALRRGPLWQALTTARRIYRELDFVLDLGPAVLRGQIDLLHEDADGRLHIVDYKSDRVEPEHLAEHARRYELQMLAYALAAGRHFGRCPGEATLYFLRPGRMHVFAIDPGVLDSAGQRIQRLAREMIRCRRAGQFERRRGESCPYCFHEPLCDPGRT